MKKIILILVLLTAMLSISAYAANCGGSTPCSCGDSLNESRTLDGSDNLTNCPVAGLYINASGVTLDCNGFAINGTNAGSNRGIEYSSNVNNTILKNCIIRNFNLNNGISLAGYFHSIINNTLYDVWDGISITTSFAGSNNILNNTIYDANYKGIYISYSNNNNISGNKVFDCGEEGIRYQVGSYSFIENNNVSNNSCNGINLDSCFLAGTKILMGDSTYKNIEDVKEGDFVQSYDEKTGEVVEAKVRKTFYHEKSDGYLIINSLLEVTANHPMYVNGEWKPAGEIKVRDLLLDKEGNNVPVFSVEPVGDAVPTYNLEVAGNHNYFANDILAHNKCPRIFTHNGEDYEFDLLINVAQFGEEHDKLFDYPVKHLAEPRILMEYEPSEINYVDFIKVKITDKALQAGLEDKEYILNPISCISDFGCDLNKLTERDQDYLLLDENNSEYYIEFEAIPALEPGYDREMTMLSSGYQIKIGDTDYLSNPDYILDFMREYELSGRGNSYNTVRNNIINGNGFGSCGAKYGGIAFINAESHGVIENNTLTGNYRGIVLGSSINVTISKNTISNNANSGLLFSAIGANITVSQNNIFNNSNYEVNSSVPIELSLNNLGNYWGRSLCPHFYGGVTSNNLNVRDSYPYSAMNAWLAAGVPGSCPTLILLNQTIYNNELFEYNVTAFDSSGIDNFIVNNSNSATNFSINSSGFLTNITPLIAGTYVLTISANDTLGYSNQALLTLSVLELNTIQHATNQTTYVMENITQVLFDFGSSAVRNIIIPSTISSSAQITLNMSALLNGTNITIPNEITLIREGASVNYTAVIPAGTIMSGPPGWDGTIMLPSISTGSFSAPSGSVDVVVNLGTTFELNFTNPVQVIIGGMAGKRAAWSRGGALTDISTVCDNLTLPTNINNALPRECYGDLSADLAIWTYHFTNFGAYTPGGGVSGGGGSGAGRTYLSQGTVSELLPLKLTLLRLQRITFIFREQIHSITLKSISDTTATFSLESLPNEVTLMQGQSENVDITGDNAADVKLTLLKLTRFSAEVMLEELAQVKPSASNVPPLPVDEEQAEPKSVAEQITESEYVPEQRIIDTGYPPISYKKKSMFAWLVWPVLIALIAVAVYFLVFRNKPKLRR